MLTGKYIYYVLSSESPFRESAPPPPHLFRQPCSCLLCKLEVDDDSTAGGHQKQRDPPSLTQCTPEGMAI